MLILNELLGAYLAFLVRLATHARVPARTVEAQQTHASPVLLAHSCAPRTPRHD